MNQDLIRRFPLRPGSHRTRDDGMCAMEMVAWLAGEEHSDEPRCACPVLGAVVRSFNDILPDDDARSCWLRPLIPLLVNSRADAATERRRAYALLDAVVRRLAPRVLVGQYRRDWAGLLAALPPLTGPDATAPVLPLLEHPSLKAVRWMAQRAAEDALPVQLWVAAAVWVARSAPVHDGWALLARAIADAARVGREPAPAPLQRAHG